MSDPFVELRDIRRQWDGKGGVRGVSLSVARGEFVAILGPSGCGKSTLLRLLAGLEVPQSGQILIGGQEVTHAAPSARGLSMVFQNYALFPHLNVRENILFGMKVRRASRAEQAAKLAEAVAMTGLEGLEDRKPGALSGGQRQRVALARAVVAGHPLCLMDEPLSNLDAKLRHSVRRDIKALQRRLGLTVVYVTHDQSEAMSLSDKVVLMKDGAVQQQGHPEDLYARPATPFVAEFIGDPPMALVEGAALGLAAAQVGIRVEKIERAHADDADLVAEVEACEFLGGETRVLLSHPRARGLGLILPGRRELAPGTALGLALPDEHRILFPAQGGQKDPQQNYGATDRQTAPRDGRKAPSQQTEEVSR
ncbi:ABC transporter ATP-binding protein [Pseudooceanicola sp. 200-1SW]|uniref:ABC transporter ATP-binding protein n=1 Tax=Pseudooceanicola sp. 200-1SW TaxID=3425949 RepID=UPI003D7FAA28